MANAALLPSRKLTATIMAGGFLVLSVTGLVMFLWPPREVAMATHHAVLGMGKKGWENIHLGVSFLFIALGLMHIWWNRGALLAYFNMRKDSAAAGRVALGLGLVVAAAALGVWAFQ